MCRAMRYMVRESVCAVYYVYTGRPRNLGQVGSSKSVRDIAESESSKRILVDEHRSVACKVSEL